MNVSLQHVFVGLLMTVLLIPALAVAEADPFVPSPEGLSAKKITATRVVLKWYLPQAEEDDVEVDHYEIQISKDDTVVKNLQTASWKKVVRGLEPNTTYRFLVRSVGVNDEKSFWSDYLSFTTTEPMRFVMLEDTATETLDSIYPGSDIDAVELTRTDGRSYALTVVDSMILNGDIGNSYSDPSQALDAPDFFEATGTGYVSMGGPGAYMILRMERSINGEAKNSRSTKLAAAKAELMSMWKCMWEKPLLDRG